MKKGIAIGIVIGILISGVVAYASIVLSSDKVSYNNTTVESSLNSLFNDSLTGKNNIISALSSKGFNVTDSSTYNEIVNSINELPIKLSKDEEGNYGYILEGSDTVNSFKNEDVHLLTPIGYDLETDIGTASMSSHWDRYDAMYAFAGIQIVGNGARFATGSAIKDAWIQYEFNEPKYVDYVTTYMWAYGKCYYNIALQVSYDGETFENITTIYLPSAGAKTDHQTSVINKKKVKIVRFVIDSTDAPYAHVLNNYTWAIDGILIYGY